jgi:hypothetical protein
MDSLIALSPTNQGSSYSRTLPKNKASVTDEAFLSWFTNPHKKRSNLKALPKKGHNPFLNIDISINTTNL